MKYVNGETVIVSKLGENTPGSWFATIRGMFGEGFYIVEWFGFRPNGMEYWDCSVIIESCIESCIEKI